MAPSLRRPLAPTASRVEMLEPPVDCCCVCAAAGDAAIVPILVSWLPSSVAMT